MEQIPPSSITSSMEIERGSIESHEGIDTVESNSSSSIIGEGEIATGGYGAFSSEL